MKKTRFIHFAEWYGKLRRTDALKMEVEENENYGKTSDEREEEKV
jgi:hypothetical protein